MSTLLTTSTPWASTGGQTLWVPDSEAPGKPLLIHIHGYQGNFDDVCANPQFAEIAVSQGWHVLSHGFGGTTTWANDASMTSLGLVVDAARVRGHERIALCGVSMGGALALRYLREEGDVEGAILGVPVVDLEWLVDSASAFASAIETAHGGAAAWASVKETVNPARHRFDAEHVQIWYSEDDDAVGAAPGFTDRIRKFAWDAKVEAHSLGVVGHSLNGLDSKKVIKFLDRC